MTDRDYCFELKSQLSELKTLCRHLEDCGNMMQLPQKCLFEINLGLDELFTKPTFSGANSGCSDV